MKFYVSSRQSEVLLFDGLLLYKSYKVSAKKVRKSYLSWHWRVMQSLKENWLVVSNMTWEIWWFFTQPLKSLNISFQWAPFVQNIQGSSNKNTEELSFTTLNSDAKLRPGGFHNGISGIRLTFIRALKSLKNCTLMGSFCPKHIMFQLENFIGIMGNETEGDAKFEKNESWSEKSHKEFG